MGSGPCGKPQVSPRNAQHPLALLQASPLCKKEVGWCGYAEPIDTFETRKSSSACNSAEQWFSLGIFSGITVVVYVHNMTVGFWICLPSDRGSHVLNACSRLGLKWAQRVCGRRDCLLQVGLSAYYTVWKGARLDIVLKFKTGGCREEKNLFLSPCVFPPSFLTSTYTLDFQLFFCFEYSCYSSFLLVCFCFILEILFFPKHFLPSTSPKKTNCCGMIYAGSPKFLLMLSIIPMPFHHKRQGEKKSELNQREACSWETRVWICKLMTNFPKYLPTPNYV